MTFAKGAVKVLYHGEELGLAISRPASASGLARKPSTLHVTGTMLAVVNAGHDCKVLPQSKVTVGADVTIKLDSAMFQVPVLAANVLEKKTPVL